MYKVKVSEKDASTKREMACCSRKQYTEQDLLNITLEKKAGFIHTGEYSSFTLLVFDFDLSLDLKGTGHILKNFQWFKKINEAKPYLKVFTPSGGMHLYFIFDEPFVFPNRAKLKTFDDNVVCDIRGHNGIIFAPGTRFEKEQFNRDYMILDKFCEKRIYKREELQLIYDIFGLGIEPKDDDYYLHYDIAIQPKDREDIKKDPVIIEYSSNRDYPYDFWEQIYDGKYQISHGNVGKVPEYLIWRNLWLWIYHRKIPFDEAMKHLAETQSSFNYKETVSQLKYVDFNYYPSSKVASQLYKTWNMKSSHNVKKEVNV